MALDASERTDRALERVLPDLVLRLSADGRLLDYRAGRSLQNTHLLAPFLGASLADLGGAIPGFDPAVISNGLAALRSVLETGAEATFAIRSPSGKDLEVRLFPTDDAQEIVALVRDVSAERRLERRLAVSERMATVGTVAAGVAHEINNPLTYVLANAGLALEELAAVDSGKPLDTHELRAMLSDVLDGARRVQRIVGDLRVFSRVGETEQRRSLDVREIVDSAVQLTITELRHRAVLERDYRRSVSVVADPSRLAQVFVNLLVNATQALPGEGPVKHRVRVTVDLDEQGWQCVEVSDTGPGIAAETLSRVFEPFYTTRAERGGTGLGLSICQRIVVEHGGFLEVESVLGEGATFRVRLPPAPVRHSTTPPAGPPHHAPLRGRILIVDDEVQVARALARTLSPHGVLCVHSADEALAALERSPFDLVLCDLMMPDKSGAELFEEAIARWPQLEARFVFLTGGALSPATASLLAARPEQWLAKPLLPKLLRERVAAELAQHGPLR